MNVADICQRQTITVRQTDELTHAARLMREHHIGYLVVVVNDFADGSQRPVGVLTDRDIVIGVVARDTDPRTLRVGEVMTEEPVVIDEAESIHTALREMRRIGVRRLPVVSARGQLAGVLSLDDVIDALAGEMQNVAGSLRNERRIEGALRP